MKIEVIETSYCIGLTLEEFKKILDFDRVEEDKEDDNPLFELGMSLAERLDAIVGVENVDYNGHFGPNIFLNVEKIHDGKPTWRYIKDTINSIIK